MGHGSVASYRWHRGWRAPTILPKHVREVRKDEGQQQLWQYETEE